MVETRFDTSECPEDRPAVGVGFQIGKNKKVIGKFKDEAGGQQTEEFVGLQAKVYSYKMHEGVKKKEVKKCKGITKSVIKKYITYQDYKTCLLTGEDQMRTMNIIQRGDEMFSESIRKIALSAADDKRHIL